MGACLWHLRLERAGAAARGLGSRTQLRVHACPEPSGLLMSIPRRPQSGRKMEARVLLWVRAPANLRDCLLPLGLFGIGLGGG